MRLFDRIRGRKDEKGMTFSSTGGYGDQFWPFGWLRLLPGSQFDYRREAGLLWENSTALSGMTWIANNFVEAPLTVFRDVDGKAQSVEPHPFTELMASPNADYDSAYLFGGTVLSLIADGNAFYRVIRNGLGEPVELWYVPHWQINPRWKADGSEFISDYVYRINGKDYPVEKRDIIHLRHGIPDPRNPRRALSPLSAVLREVCTDNEASTLTAALLRNPAYPSMILSPKADMKPPTQDQRDDVKRQLGQINGDRAGSVGFLPFPMEIQKNSFSPAELAIDKVVRLPVAKICSALNIDPMVLHLPSENKTYANYGESVKAAYGSCLIPMQKSIGRQLKRQLPEMFADGEYPGFDYEHVLALSEDENDKYKRYQGVSFLTTNEKRQALGYKPIEGGDELSAATNEPAKDEEDDKKPKPKPKADDDETENDDE